MQNDRTTDADRGVNVLGEPLASCSTDPLTGFFRDGCCTADPRDLGRHLVCARVTAQFLEFSKARGNDLVTPRPEFGFAGLEPGDQWCLCVTRWREALEHGVAPPVLLQATHEATLGHVDLADLKAHALDLM